MKKMLMVLVLVLIAFAQSLADSIRFAPLVRFDNAVTMDTNFDRLIDKGGAFTMARLYLDVIGDITKDVFGNSITARITPDLAVIPYIKYAYFDYKIMNELVISAGQMPLAFGSLIYKVTFPYIPTPVTRLGTWINTDTDLGIKVSGNAIDMSQEKECVVTKKVYLTNEDQSVTVKDVSETVKKKSSWKLLNYHLYLINGEGYKNLFVNSSNSINNYAGIASLYIQPVQDLFISGGFRYQDTSTVTNITQDMALNVTAFGKEVMGLPFEFLVEFQSRSYLPAAATTSVTGITLGGFAGLYLFDKFLTPYIGFNMSDGNTDAAVTNDVKMLLDCGLILKPAKSDFQVELFYSYNLVDKGVTSGNMEAALRFQFSPSFTVTK